jgi:hypothetical protein
MISRPSVALVARVVWFIAMIAVLATWLSLGSDAPAATKQNGERHLLAFIVMVALTFPAGLIWAGLLNIVTFFLESFGYYPDMPDFLAAVFVWVGFVAIGYFQWFKLFPLLRRKRGRGK